MINCYCIVFSGARLEVQLKSKKIFHRKSMMRKSSLAIESLLSHKNVKLSL
jgi:hypothetical protein